MAVPGFLRRVCLPLGATFIGGLTHAAEGVPIADRAVDMLRLVDGKQLLGMFASAPEENVSADKTVTFYVARDWLRKRQPAFYRKLAAGEEARRRAALEQYRQRLTEWRQRRPEPKLLSDFIQRSLRDVEARLQDAKPAAASQLLVVELPAKQVKRWQAQSGEVRKLLALAWEARIEDAEESPVRELSERLKRQGIDARHDEPDLSDRFGLVPLSPRQWAAKKALIEFEILGMPRFQGMGATLLEVDDAANQPPLAALAGELLQDQLGEALGDLLNPQPGAGRKSASSDEQPAVRKALAAAADKNATGVRITYLNQDLVRRRATVTDSFHALMPDGTWQSIWRKSATAGSDDKQADADALAADPQVAEIMQTIKGLGLDANQDLLQSALRFGAATQQAMRETEREFAGFLRCHTRRLLGPPISVPEGKAQP